MDKHDYELGLEPLLPEYVNPDLWLDENHCIEFTKLRDDVFPCGAILWHRKPYNALSATSGWCARGFQWRGPGIHWELHSLSPLHVEPSIRCSCGEHGFIRDDKWVPA